MKQLNTKYIGFLLVLLVLAANINFAYSQINCPMNMNKTACCTEDKVNEKGNIFTKINCCKEVTTEINNSSSFQNFSFENKTVLALFIIPQTNIIQAEKGILHFSYLSSNHSPPRDIQLLNSSFRI